MRSDRYMQWKCDIGPNSATYNHGKLKIYAQVGPMMLSI